ncbi:hypothetical protein BDV25DRAFT_141848 [Aspergillus avenaceus]|uniref:Uncharacterized protein n=1 Tax=Aspergillus avenaceus TaxID=36643 RepID=A0A5N6TPU3_ASPAV|nr:hypothetical protein BDV25DRAFT_141848 [Aspergillus avenaceus]
MSTINSQPTSPAGWKEYADLLDIPLKEASPSEEDEVIATYRNVYLDSSTLSEKSVDRLYIYTDVLAFTESEVTISPPKASRVYIFTRVLTADAPVNIRLSPAAESTCSVLIYASILDQPVTISAGGSIPTTLQLGPGTGHLGLAAVASGDGLEVEYENLYSVDQHFDFEASLQTQLRIALALFWRNSSIAISLCAHVAAATSKPSQYPLINAQAVSLGQQLAAQAMSGPNSSYVPVLPIDTYMDTLQTAMVATSTFEDQYERFHEDGLEVDDQLKAANVMLQTAINQKGMRTNQRDTASSKYESASKVASNCNLQLQLDSSELVVAQVNFEEGIREWKLEQSLKAAFSIITAIVTFAVGIGEMCMGDPAGEAGAAAAVENAVQEVEAAEELAEQTGKYLSSDTMKKLKDCSTAMQEIYELMDSIYTAVKGLESDPSAEIPSIDQVSGSSQGDADAEAIVAIAAWDKWILESDDQMSFAVGEGIGGASDYQLALRKHAINGKQLAQAQAEAVKAGQEYVQAQMEVVVCENDIENLQALIDQYKDEEGAYVQAAAKFYDRFMALKTSLVIEMRNVLWAYKYYALKDSSVTLDSQKSAADYQQDVFVIKQELENVDSEYASDDQVFKEDVKSEKLPSNYHKLLVEGLKGSDHSASFTLVPDTDTTGENTTRESFASVFNDGYHYRLDGLRVQLRGAKSASEDTVTAKLQISTSGVYSDTTEDKELLNFTSIPQVKRFHYDLSATGEIGETRVDSIFEAVNHTEPPPFAQWTIKVANPDELDLDGLTGIDLHWEGRARYEPIRRRKA